MKRKCIKLFNNVIFQLGPPSPWPLGTKHQNLNSDRTKY